MKISLGFGKKLWIPVVLLVLVGGGYTGFSKTFTHDDKIQYLVIKPQDYISTITASGKITSDKVISIRTEIAGIVEAIDLDRGAPFVRGETLATIRNKELDQKVQEAQIKLKIAENKIQIIEDKEGVEAEELLYQAEITLQQQKLIHERIKELYEQGAVSASEWEQAQYNYALSISKHRQAAFKAEAYKPTGSIYKEAVNGLEEARIALEKAKIEQGKARITAPFNGLVLDKAVEIGEFVSPGNELMKIVKDEPLKVKVSVDESFIPKLYGGQLVMIKPEAFQGEVIKGQIEKIAPAVKPDTGTIDVEIQLENPPNYLKRELTVLVEIISGSYTDAIIIEKSYLTGDQNNMVWVLKDGVAVQKEIRIGENLGDRVWVAEGLVEGEIVLFPGKFKEGASLKLPEVEE